MGRSQCLRAWRLSIMFVIRVRSKNRKDGVNKLLRSNIFEASAVSIAELFSDYLDSNDAATPCVALALSAHTASSVERNAIEKSLEALGYGPAACTFASLFPTASAAETPSGGACLDGQALFLLVEGLDPLCVIATDQTATNALGDAYRTAFELDSAIRVFGRSSVAFRNLASLLQSDDGKQKAWRLFKSLPKRS